jgi:hypothetical protein
MIGGSCVEDWCVARGNRAGDEGSHQAPSRTPPPGRRPSPAILHLRDVRRRCLYRPASARDSARRDENFGSASFDESLYRSASRDLSKTFERFSLRASDQGPRHAPYASLRGRRPPSARRSKFLCSGAPGHSKRCIVRVFPLFITLISRTYVHSSSAAECAPLTVSP